MEIVSLLSILYSQFSLETVARHEVGHAVMAVQCGGSVKRIILGRDASCWNKRQSAGGIIQSNVARCSHLVTISRD